MNQSTPKSNPSLQVATLKPSKAPEPKGCFTRAQLTQVFSDYIYAYLHTATNLLSLSPTMMFVMHELQNPNPTPLAIPFNIGDYDVESLEGFVSLLIEQYPPERFALHMVMYTRFDPKFMSKEEYKVMFCAKDAWGARVYSVYKVKHFMRHDTMQHYPMEGGDFDRWVKTSDFVDPYLTTALNMYYTLISFRKTKQYAN